MLQTRIWVVDGKTVSRLMLVSYQLYLTTNVSNSIPLIAGQRMKLHELCTNRDGALDYVYPNGTLLAIGSMPKSDFVDKYLE